MLPSRGWRSNSAGFISTRRSPDGSLGMQECITSNLVLFFSSAAARKAEGCPPRTNTSTTELPFAIEGNISGDTQKPKTLVRGYVLYFTRECVGCHAHVLVSMPTGYRT